MYNSFQRRDVAQLGSALPWGGRGHQFKSGRSDHFFIQEKATIGDLDFI